MPLAGSCSHKVYPDMEKLSYKILDEYPSAHIYLTGEPALQEHAWEHDRIHHVFNVPIKQVFLMTKYADLVIGPETGTMVAAGMWGTPKVQLCTASSVFQCTQYHKNDYSIQSNVKCSPCHRAMYNYEDCENMIKIGRDYDGKELFYPACVFGFDINYILGVTEKVYNETNIYNKFYADRFIKRGKSEIGKELYAKRWELINKHCKGKLKLLDYGCASGAFHKSSTNGFDCDGFDVNPYYGFKKIPKGKIDILTMWDVIEHLSNPKEVIKQFNADWLFVCTPNKGAVEGNLKDWLHYRPREHLWYFDYSSLKELFNELGYEIIDCNYDEGVIRNPQRPKDIITVVGKKCELHV